MTLDEDDVVLAKALISNPSSWDEKKIISQYEMEFSRWNNSKFAFAFMSGRVSLSACIYALNLQPGDEVILPAYTCVVVPNAFYFAGIKPVYCDIELETYGLDVNEVKAHITPRVRAILLHHLYGLVCRDYHAILDLAKCYSLSVIEDCCHATGAKYRGEKVGNLGDVAFYSSEQSKIFNTIQGGFSTTNNLELANKMKEYYNCAAYPDSVWIQKQLYNVLLNFYECKHPKKWILRDIIQLRYGHKRLLSTTAEEEKGIRPKHYGCKMPAPIAAIGSNQIKKLDYYNSRRRETAKYWDIWCENNNYTKPVVIDNSVPVYLRYPVLVEPFKKQNRSWANKQLGVDLGIWFASNIHPSKNIKGFPKADKAVECCINLPCLMQ
ncbi:DegT/DnrJ/EryC1/StrS aminotransferase family protein [Acaryochloris sp. CCMEE 5410]|uniref:DegT/DnrJ/EryC1/StrS family aminotransferase n=1 Tax=Acaryochloris sp. CCMEE 5410 TaxID=310037 RepID=UPI001585CC3C|nr:DegT/DnrJ/EryC1/StrS family aminotransferase [Acaryochloris sp. CCMEE 5410]KAI9132383.1 DegT/DnrJ/EryC1/StrS family aminotransferase [Acaryochloris sp. CCMEE 5410]